MSHLRLSEKLLHSGFRRDADDVTNRESARYGASSGGGGWGRRGSLTSCLLAGFFLWRLARLCGAASDGDAAGALDACDGADGAGVGAPLGDGAAAAGLAATDAFVASLLLLRAAGFV
ncbi:MAG TPA: hypothetical protein VLU41_10225, partial [Ideonella sp.]|nr:hypothetical protein [Ideonella sp.]